MRHNLLVRTKDIFSEGRQMHWHGVQVATCYPEMILHLHDVSNLKHQVSKYVFHTLPLL